MHEAFVRTILDEVPAARSSRSRIRVRRLREQAADVRTLRRRCDYDAAAARLPQLITDAHQAANDGSRAALSLLTHLCFDASFAARAIADAPTATMAADRAARAAYLTGNPVLMAGAAFAQAHAALRHDAADRSLSIAREHLAYLPAASPELSALRGMLRLTEALSLSRTWTPRWPVVQDHLAEAHAELPGSRHSRDRFDLTFSPTNIQIWSLSIALELCELDSACTLASTIDPDTVTKASRRCALLLDMARLSVRTGNPDRAVELIARADRAAPQYLWSRSSSHGLLRSLLHNRLTGAARSDLHRMRQSLRPTSR